MIFLNKEYNKAISELISEDAKKEYEYMFEYIKNDFNNIHYLLEYSIKNEDNDVTKELKNFLKTNFDIKNIKQVDEKTLDYLYNYYNNNYETVIKLFYGSYNLFDNCVEELKYIASNDAELDEGIKKTFNCLDIFRDTVHQLTDFLIYFCAIRYICRNNTKINIGIIRDMNMKCFELEIIMIRDKIAFLLYAHENKSYDLEGKKVSIYDTKAFLRLVTKDCLNSKLIKAIEVMNNSFYSYDKSIFTIYFISYYFALWDTLLSESTYKCNFESDIYLEFLKISDILKELFGDEKDYVKLLNSFYLTAREQFASNDENLISDDVITKIYKTFVNRVANIEKVTFIFYFSNIYIEIKDFISGNNNKK